MDTKNSSPSSANSVLIVKYTFRFLSFLVFAGLLWFSADKFLGDDEPKSPTELLVMTMHSDGRYIAELAVLAVESPCEVSYKDSLDDFLVRKITVKGKFVVKYGVNIEQDWRTKTDFSGNEIALGGLQATVISCELVPDSLQWEINDFPGKRVTDEYKAVMVNRLLREALAGASANSLMLDLARKKFCEKMSELLRDKSGNDNLSIKPILG